MVVDQQAVSFSLAQGKDSLAASQGGSLKILFPALKGRGEHTIENSGDNKNVFFTVVSSYSLQWTIECLSSCSLQWTGGLATR